MKSLRSMVSILALIIVSTQAAFAACTPVSMAPTDVTAGTVQAPYSLTFSASGSAATPFAYEITSGVLPGGLTLDGVSGALTGTPSAAGSFPFTVTATDTAGCSGGRSYVLDIAQANQTISFTSTAPASATVGGATYAVSATATSGLPVAFTIDASASAVCSIAGSTVSFIGVGTCVIDANQAGDANFTAAPQVQQSFAVGQGAQTITFTSTPPAAASVGGPTYNVTATATSGLPVTFTIDATATSVCSIAGSTVSFLAAGTCVIDADQAGNANYAAAPQAQQSFGVGKSAQTITFTSTAPAAATVGGATYSVTATASSGLTVTFTIDASASSVCTIAGSTVSFIGAGNCVIDANQAGDVNYNPAPQVQQTFAVGKGSQTITYTSTAPAAATVGGATYTVTATASSGLTVALTIDATATSVCSIAGSTVSFLAVGTCVIDADQPGDANYNAAPQVQQSFAVGKGNQTISFTSTAPAGATVGGATYTVTATASSGLAVAFTIDASATSVCSIAASTVSFIGVGTCVIDANQAGDANYNAAPQVQQSFAVGQGAQTITFTSTAPAAATVGGPTYTVTATASSGLAVTFTIDAAASSVCSIAGSTVSFNGAGTCVIDANQAGNANYLPAPQAQQSFGVNKNNQTITFTSAAPAGAVVAGPTYTVTATATSGLTVTFTIDATATSVCSIAGSTVSFIGVGTCVIDADQAGNGSFNPAPQVQQSFAVGKGNQTISFTSSAPAGATFGGPTYTVTATATSGLAVTFSIDASAASVCSIAGSTVSFIGAGTCVIDANQAGNANYNAAPQVQQSFPVAKANQTISFTSSPPATPTVGGPTYTVSAAATSGLAVTLTIDATATSVCSIAGTTVSFIGNGACVIDANQAGNANYNPAPQVQQSFAVKSNQTITFTSSPPATPTVGGATYTVTATATSGLAVVFTIDASATSVCSIAGSTVSFIGAGTCVIDANQPGNGSFYAAPQVQQSFTVKNAQTITFTSTAPAAAVYQGPTYTVTATASSGLSVTLSIDASASTICTLAGSTVSFIGTGTCVIDANQAGNASFYPAPQVQQSFTVGPNLGADSYSVVGNTQLVVAGQSAPTTPFTTDPTTILANDTSDAAIVLTTVTGVATTGGGLITIDASGKLTYTPPVGQSSGTDTYVYTGTSNGISRTATITFNISNIVWFVDNSSVGTHDGRSNTPFTNMGAAANGLGTALAGSGPAANAFIYVARGTGTTTGAYTFKTGQTLIGAGATLTVGALSIAGIAANTPTLGGTLTLAGTVTINGIDMNTGASAAITGNAVTGINVTARTVTTTSGSAVTLAGAGNTGSMTFTTVNTNGAAKGISIANFSGPFAINGTGGLCDSTHTSAADCTGGTIQGSSARGAEFTNATGGVTLNNIYFKGDGTTAITVGAGCNDSNSSGTSNVACNAALYFVNSTNATLNQLYLDGTGSADMGLNVNALNGLTVNGLEIANFAGNQKDAATLQNLTGTVGFTGLNMHNNALAHNVFISNTTGTANITFTSPLIQNSPLAATGNADGINAQAYNAGTTLNVTSTNGTFNNIIGDTTNWAANSGAHMTATLTGGSSTGTGGVYMASTGTNTQMTYTISGLTSITTNANGSNAVTVGRLNGTNISETGTISNNTIVTGSSACSTCSGIVINSYATSGVANISVTGNNVSGNNFNAMNVVGASGGNSLNLTVHGNTFATSQTPVNDGYALDITSGAAAGDSDCVFLDVGDMSVGHSNAANNNTVSGSNWVNGAGGNTISVASFNNSLIKILNYTGANDAAASTWIGASNTNGGTDAFHVGTNQFVGGTSCP